MLHVPHVHVPHVPHPDLRQLARDVTLATEVVLASVVLTGSVALGVREAVGSAAPRPPRPAPAADDHPATVPFARIDLTRAGGVVADVHVPATGDLAVSVVDTAGAVVATIDAVRGTTAAVRVPPGTYRLLVRQESPVEHVGDVAISAASVLRSDALTLAEGESLTVRLLPAS